MSVKSSVTCDAGGVRARGSADAEPDSTIFALAACWCMVYLFASAGRIGSSRRHARDQYSVATPPLQGPAAIARGARSIEQHRNQKQEKTEQVMRRSVQILPLDEQNIPHVNFPWSDRPGVGPAKRLSRFSGMTFA